MNILITGARGFVGQNLKCALENIQNGNDRRYAERLKIVEIYAFDKDDDPAELATYVSRADFIFHLAGVNRVKDIAEFQAGNVDFTESLLNLLRKYHNTCPIVMTSSIQAALIGRYVDSPYGLSKAQGEEKMFAFQEEHGNPVFIYRLVNLFGKWCRPNYNSFVTTMCYNYAHDLPVTIDDENNPIDLLYIDDLIEGFIKALLGKVVRCDYAGLKPLVNDNGKYAYIPGSHHVTLREVKALLESFKQYEKNFYLIKQEDNTFAKKLYATYLSYLPGEKSTYDIPLRSDVRGAFGELFKTEEYGQVSVNITYPNETKGQHFHHTKWEIFIVLHGEALIEERSLNDDHTLSFKVSGEQLKAVYMLPGYTHAITNISDHEPLITLIYASESFDPERPDTYYLPLK